MKKVLIIAAIAALAFGSSAYASTITLTTPGVVGIIDLNSYNDNASPTTRQAYANWLLLLTENRVDSVHLPPVVYYTSARTDSGTVDLGYKVDGSPTGFGGYTYLLAKYNGPNAGYVLFHIPSIVGTSIPSTAGTQWWDGGVNQEYGLSGWTAYNFVPDGGSVAMLLGAALMGLAGFRRMLK